MSAPQWLTLTSKDGGVSPFIQLADMGYTVYMGSNRGNYVSQGHNRLSAQDEEYWQFGFEGYAEDVLANILAVSTENAGKKGTYFGYSLGTLQMLIALTKYEEELAKHLEKITLLAPCTLLDNPVVIKPEPLTAPGSLKAELKKAGINAYFGPNWDYDAICAVSEPACGYVSFFQNPEFSPPYYH